MTATAGMWMELQTSDLWGRCSKCWASFWQCSCTAWRTFLIWVN